MRRVIWGVTVGLVIQEKDVKSTIVATIVKMEELAYHQLWVNIWVSLYIQIIYIFPYMKNNITSIPGNLIENILT